MRSSLTFILAQISPGRSFVQRGVDLYKVQRLLGHKTSHMTQRYAHHGPESLRDGVTVLDMALPVGINLTPLPIEESGRLSKVLE